MIGGTPRILIVRLSAIGDVVRVLPALHVLRSAYPDAQVDWVSERKCAALLDGHPVLDRLLVFERGPQWSQAFWRFCTLCREIRRTRYDIVLDFHGILKSGIILGCSGAKERYGFARPRSQEGSSLFANRKVLLPAERINRSEENLLLCSALLPGCDWPGTLVFVPDEVQEAVDAFFDGVFDGGKWVVSIHVPVDREEKQWPVGHFATLADLLLADGRFEVMLTWGPGQLPAVKAVVAKTRRNPVVAPETPDLKHYAWLVHRAALYFGCDTGPMHIAAAMGTPVVAVFGGTDPVQHAPFGQHHTILTDADATAYPDAPLALSRLHAVTPEMAYQACVRAMAE